MEIRKELKETIEKIFESKKEFHKERSKLPIEEKIRILVELQKIGKTINPEKTKDKRVWEI